MQQDKHTPDATNSPLPAMAAVPNDSRGPHLYATDTYEDITSDLRAQAEKLGPGGLEQVPGVRLYDCLPSIQIGVQKLDTGTPSEFKTLEDELAAGETLFPLDSEANCVIVIDKLREAEMAWHRGHSGLQTVLSCLLVERELVKFTKMYPFASDGQLLPSPSHWSLASLLEVYLWSVIRGFSLAIQLIEREGANVVFPEEDFYPMRYELNFLDAVPVQTMVERVEQARKAAKLAGHTALAQRLDLQSVWITVLNQKVPKKSTNLTKLGGLVAEWGASPTNASSEQTTLASAAWFTRGAQARLGTACLRHPLPVLSRSEAETTWKQISEAVQHLTALNTVARSTDLLGLLLNFSGRQEVPLVRAIAKSKFTEQQALGQSMRTWVTADITETSAVPPGLRLSGTNKQAFDLFAAQAALCYADLMASFTMNRCRLREALSSLTISFDSLQVSAEQTDGLLSQSVGAPVTLTSSWTLFRKLQVMLWVVLMSFETDVVGYSEQVYTYWYAHELSQLQLGHLQRMRRVFELVRNGRNAPGYGFLAALELEAQMLQQLCLAELLVWLVLHRMKPPKNVAHSSPEMRFRLRFRAFDSVGVPALPTLAQFEKFAKAWDIKLALQGAANATKTATTLLKSLASLAAENRELALLQRSAVALSVAVMRLVKLDRPPSEVKSQASGFHAYFPVPEWK